MTDEHVEAAVGGHRRRMAFRKQEFLRAFGESCDFAGSMRHARVSRWTVRLWLQKDPAFRDAYDERLADFRGQLDTDWLYVIRRTIAQENWPAAVQAMKGFAEKIDRAAARLDGLGTVMPITQLAEQLAWAQRALEDFVPPVAEDGTPSAN